MSPPFIAGDFFVHRRGLTPGSPSPASPSTQAASATSSAAGYVGDALMDDIEVRIAEGALRVRQSCHQVLVYAFKNNGAQARMIVVEHPLLADWELLGPAAPSERTANHYRFDLPLPGKAAAALTVRTERQVWESFSLLDAPLDRFLSCGRSGTAPEPVHDALDAIWRT